MQTKSKRAPFPAMRLSPMRALALGFAFIILAGAILLRLPIAAREGVRLSLIDALFTATSAACVTGLVVADTYAAFTPFGQAVLLALIQVGGLGFMTFAALFSLLAGKRLGLKGRALLMESVAAPQLGGVVALIGRVAKITFLIETIGAALLSTRMIPALGLGRGIWFSVFHAVSAFCNAGFDLMGIWSPYSSLTRFVSDPVVNAAVISLILVGGLGFWVWDDIRLHGLRFQRYRLHSKLMLVTSALFVAIPTLAFYFLEENASFAGLGRGDRLLAALFQAVTPRTAGFNTTDTAALSTGGYVLTSFLMFVGGGVGSTAGGMKVTTLALLALSLASFARGNEDVCAFSRRIESKQLRTAYSSAAMHAFIALAGLLLLCALQPELSLRDAIFEVLSAVDTVGMTTGVTRDLNGPARVLIMLLMYIGRIGTLSFLLVLAGPKKPPRARFPEEQIVI